MWYMRFVAFGTEQYGNTDRLQYLDVSLEGRMCGLSTRRLTGGSRRRSLNVSRTDSQRALQVSSEMGLSSAYAVPLCCLMIARLIS